MQLIVMSICLYWVDSVGVQLSLGSVNTLSLIVNICVTCMQICVYVYTVRVSIGNLQVE